MTDIKQYSERDAMELDEVGGHYFRHVLAMTAEGLHSKSEIAAELGWRDMQIAELQERLSRYSMSAGQADQRKGESNAVRVALGFAADADDVAPCDLVDAIAALQEQVRALAAENAALNLALEPQEVPDELQDLLNDTTQLASDSDGCQSWSWVENPDEVIRVVLRAIKPETPATDAVLREIRAQAVADIAMRFHESAFVAFEYSDETGPFIRADLQQYAASILAGEQPCVNVE